MGRCPATSGDQSYGQFYANGCPNCEKIFASVDATFMQDRASVMECTSASFSGYPLWSRDASNGPNGQALTAAAVRARVCVCHTARTIAMMQPKQSWVARWQRIGAPPVVTQADGWPVLDANARWAARGRGRAAPAGTLVPGVYAVTVQGRLPQDIVSDLEEKQIVYRPRDGPA